MCHAVSVINEFTVGCQERRETRGLREATRRNEYIFRTMKKVLSLVTVRCELVRVTLFRQTSHFLSAECRGVTRLKPKDEEILARSSTLLI